MIKRKIEGDVNLKENTLKKFWMKDNLCFSISILLIIVTVIYLFTLGIPYIVLYVAYLILLWIRAELLFDKVKIEKYFESDSEINNRVNNNRKKYIKIYFSTFIITFYALSFIIFCMMYYFYRRIFNYVGVWSLIIFLILLLTYYLNSIIVTFFAEYNFTINYALVNKTDYRRRLWTYLRYRTEILERIKKGEDIFKISDIKKQNRELVRFEELENVQNGIKNLTIKQLEFILFYDNAPVFNKNTLHLKKITYFIGVMFVFFGSDIKDYLINIISNVLQNLSMNNIIQEFSINSLERLDLMIALLVLLIIYLILPFLFVLKKFIILILDYRKSTINANLTSMLEEELKRKLSEEKTENKENEEEPKGELQ